MADGRNSWWRLVHVMSWLLSSKSWREGLLWSWLLWQPLPDVELCLLVCVRGAWRTLLRQCVFCWAG